MKKGVSYFGCRDPQHVRRDLLEMRKNGCTFVVFTYSENDYHFYSIAMKEIIELAKEVGLEIYVNPWGLGGVFGGEAFSRFVADYLEDRQVLRRGNLSVPSACFNSCEFHNFMKTWIDSAAFIGAEVIFWDEPHYYIAPNTWAGMQENDEWACSCVRCRALYQQRYHKLMSDSLDRELVSFRDQVLVDFFTTMCDYTRQKGLKNALCVLPEENPFTGVSNWELLAAIPSLDIFGTDPYWMIWGKPLEPFVRDTTRRIKAITEQYAKEPQIWIQAFMIYPGREEEVGKAVAIVAEEGIKNIAAWSFKGGAHIIYRSENYEKVWQVLGRQYRRLD